MRCKKGYNKSVFYHTNEVNVIINNDCVYLFNANSYTKWITDNKYLYVDEICCSNLIIICSIRKIRCTKYLNQWDLHLSRNGKGMRVISKINNGHLIRYGYGLNNAEHYYGGYFWRVSNGMNHRFPFI